MPKKELKEKKIGEILEENYPFAIKTNRRVATQISEVVKEDWIPRSQCEEAMNKLDRVIEGLLDYAKTKKEREVLEEIRKYEFGIISILTDCHWKKIKSWREKLKTPQ